MLATRSKWFEVPFHGPYMRSIPPTSERAPAHVRSTCVKFRRFHSGARGPTQNPKKRSENGGAIVIFHVVPPPIPRVAPGVAPRTVVFVLLKLWDAIPRMEFRILRITFLIPRAAPRIRRNSPRAPRMVFSLREFFSWNWGGPQASE